MAYIEYPYVSGYGFDFGHGHGCSCTDCAWKYKHVAFMNKNDGVIKLVQTHKDAIQPARGSSKSAGLDLFSVEKKTLKPGEFGPISIGWKMQLPEDSFGRISPRSGLAQKGIDVLAGIIDNDYRGEVKVILINHGKEDLCVAPGSKIAQMVMHRLRNDVIQVVEKLDESERGEGGFGSTGSSSSSSSSTTDTK